jgi:hypothetical protein
MYAPAPRMWTSMPWQEIDGLHPRNVLEYRAGDFECFEGLLVDDGPKPPAAPRRTSKPFRFYIPRGVNIDHLAYTVRAMVNANQNLMDVLLTR